MFFKYFLALAIHLCWASLGLADQNLTITIPWVTDAPDYFQGYGGKVLDAQDGTTTYGINCLQGHLSCHKFTPDMTVIYGPNTYDMVAKGYKFDFTSGCTLTGSPTPTMATCTETKSSHLGNGVTTATEYVPATGAQSTLGIFPAALIVTDTGDFAAISVATQPPTSDDSDTSADGLSVTRTATGISDAPTSDIMAGYLNATVTATDDLAPFGNTTSVDYSGGSTVTVTILATPIPCRCQCNCTEISPSRSLATAAPKLKNHAVDLTVPIALLGGLIAGAVFCV